MKKNSSEMDFQKLTSEKVQKLGEKSTNCSKNGGNYRKIDQHFSTKNSFLDRQK